MSSKFSLQAPYVVASLPRPIDHSSSQYVVGEVFGGAPGSKKRKRSELVVGVDGEGANLYDIISSRLITSYALPPQTSFTCPPTSLRIKTSKSRVERRTYVSTIGSHSRITLFSENTDGPSSSSLTMIQKVESLKNRIFFMGTVTPTCGLDITENTLDLLVVKENGEIQCFDGDNLQEKWTSPASALNRESTSPAIDVVVEFACLSNAHAASQGILRGRQDALAIFPQKISEDGFNPEVLIIITRSVKSRTVHIVTLPRRPITRSGELKHSVEILLSVELPSKHFSPKATFSLQVASGTLQQLCKGRLTTFDLSESLPKEISQIRSPGAQSFLRLSSTSVMVSSNNSLNVYNPKYQSILASIQVDGKPNSDTLKRKRVTAEETNGTTLYPCSLVSYFPKLGTAVGILHNELIGIQIESQGKARATGLLIDSLGCAIPGHERPGHAKKIRETGLSTMESYLPGSLAYGEGVWEELIKPLEELFTKGDTAEFDSLMASKVAFSLTNDTVGEPRVNGLTAKETELPQLSTDVDRRWIIYALGKIFSWRHEDDVNDYRLSIPFCPPNMFTWLLRTGNMTVSNIESALRHQIRQSHHASLPSGVLVDALVEMDRDMDLLHALLAKNFLDATELLSAIRHLMDSLGLLGDNLQETQKLLTNGEGLDLINGDVEEQVKQLEAEAEADLALAEYQLGPGSGIRGEALSLALSKLYTCPTNSIVYALQSTFSTQNVVALIYLLRFELARGAWTTRYIDAEHSEIIDEEADIPDNSIVLISSLLNNCIDAVGAGGWLSGDARLINGDPFEAEELIASLKLEVSAALEGIEEAAYLRGLTSEMIRYGRAVQGSLPIPGPKPPAARKRRTKPVLLPFAEQDMKILPLGLKADQQISILKVGAGGEIHERSRRDIGHLKSQKVGKYSLERIII